MMHKLLKGAILFSNFKHALSHQDLRMRVSIRPIVPGRVLFGIVAALAACSLASCQKQASPDGRQDTTRPVAEAPFSDASRSDNSPTERGRILAERWCATCHSFPEPGDLARERWSYMIKWMGNYLGHPNSDEDVKKLIYPALVPTQPSITRDDLRAIETYYVAAAPAEISPAFERDKPLPVASIFRPEAWRGYERPQIVTLVKIDAARRRLYLGTADDSFLRLFNADGRLLNQINCNKNQAVEVRPAEEGFDVALMGNLGQDVREGTAHRISGIGTGPGRVTAARLVTGFHRTSGAAWGDLDGDGDDDVVMAGFGDYDQGALSWFSVKPGEESVRHDLRKGSGTIDAVIDDVDDDMDLDILAIVAQGHQEMWWFESNGKAEFTPRLLWKERPGMGYNAFDWLDFDGDGDEDIVAVSGNNMEMFDPPLKPQHGIYVYLQTARMQFKKAHFLRMDGAIKALAFDYDRDGDMDVAAISAYPDWRSEAPVVFALFTNEGGGRFASSSIPPEFCGQPITMDAGDLDGDGDLDLVIGSANWAPLLPEPLLAKATAQIRRAPAVVLLRNWSSESSR
jgi:hypothetical protein